MASQCLYSISQCLTRHQYMSLMSLSKEPLTSVQIGWQYFRHYHIKRCTLLIEREVLETSIFRPFLGDTSMFETPFSRFSETDQKHSGNDYIPSWKFLIPHSFFKKKLFFFSRWVFFGHLANAIEGYIEMVQIITHHSNEEDGDIKDMKPILCFFW